MFGKVFPVVLSSCVHACLGQLAFTERAIEARLSHSHLTQRLSPDIEFMAAGGAAGDFNRDGWLDLFVIGGSAGYDRLYLNDKAGGFLDVSEAWGVRRQHRGSGAAVADYDGDGWPDIYVTSLGTAAGEAPGHNVLYRNTGQGSFVDVTQAAGVRFNNFTTGDAFGAAFGDADGDGDLDLVVAGWYGGNRLFRNNGNGTFTDRTAFTLPLDMGFVRGFAPRFADMDADGRQDLLWVGDFFTSRYLVNVGNGVFVDRTAASGTGLDSNGMGSAVGDFDRDGALDWYVTSRINHDQTAGSGNMLYLQTGIAHVFAESSAGAGVNMGFWGWGADAQDFDHDGWTDLVATNGYDGNFANDPNLLFINNGDGTFTERAAACGVAHTDQGRGLLTGDFDNDGDREIVVFNNRQPVRFYRNDLPPGGSITVFLDTLHDPALPPDGVGSRVIVTPEGQAPATRLIDAGTNFLAQSELSAHFGVGPAARATVAIRYADGSEDLFPDVGPGRYTIERLVCPTDFRQDGVLNFFDVSAFMGLLNTGHPMGDFNRDGLHNFFDVAAFVGAYNAGCP